VLGEFHAADEDSVVPLAWAEAAVGRWHDWHDEQQARERPGRRVIGVDVARSGADDTVIAVRQGDVIERLDAYSGQDTMVTAGLAAGLLTHPAAVGVVDVIGLGAGVLDRLREQGKPAVGFNASASTDRRDATGEFAFSNSRSAGWWKLREALDPRAGATLCLPDDEMLLADLTAPRWQVTSAGKIKVESKDTIAERLGRSTDRGDAVMQAVWLQSAPGSTAAVVGYDEPLPPIRMPGPAFRPADDGGVPSLHDLDLNPGKAAYASW
jgi:hypothetical protein